MATFIQIRKDYFDSLDGNHLDDSALEKRLSKKELLDWLKDAGVEITPRTLTYYISEGIIDKPFIGAKKTGGQQFSVNISNFLNVLNLIDFGLC